MVGWFSGIVKVGFRFITAVSRWGFAGMDGFGIRFLLKMLEKAYFAALTCMFALGGALVGTITGAITGQTTETGFFRGAGVGAVAGAVVALELLDSIIDGPTLSKVALFGSLVNGKIFREWVSPAMLKAYQSSIPETSHSEVSDIFEVDGTIGMSLNFIKKLPLFIFHCSNTYPGSEICCTICLQDFKDGDSARRLPNCRHFFHLLCIERWLLGHGSCPVCRQDV